MLKELPEIEEQNNFAEMLEEFESKRPKRGEYVQGEVLAIDDDFAVVDIGGKQDAIVPARDLNSLSEDYFDNISKGDIVPVVVTGTDSFSNELHASIEQGLEMKDWEKAEAYLESKETLTLEVTSFNKGGVIVAFREITGFIPNSHLPFYRNGISTGTLIEKKKELVGQELTLKVIEVDVQRKRFVLSPKVRRKERQRERLEELEVGQTIEGTVTNLVNFGAFLDIGGVNGLLHISKISWNRINHPSEVLQPGDKVEVVIDKIDEERMRISLNRKSLLPDPWEAFKEKYLPGDTVEGTITNIVDFGIFVELPGGLTGLAHVSEIPPGLQPDTNIMLREGMKVHVQVLRIEDEDKRIGLRLLSVVGIDEAYASEF